jgi:hypothetical protein
MSLAGLGSLRLVSEYVLFVHVIEKHAVLRSIRCTVCGTRPLVKWELVADEDISVAFGGG